MRNSDFAVVGAGLAGCECAIILARAGFSVTLFEQKPQFFSPAHKSPGVAELVCSNSLRADEETSGPGLLKAEMRRLRSPFMTCADACRVPADRALAVDREAFSRAMGAALAGESGIDLVSRRIEHLQEDILREKGPMGVIIAAGPLMGESLGQSLAEVCGAAHCYFYDAIAPIVWTDSLNHDIVFRASRHQQGQPGGDYLNCPMNREEYERFYVELLAGDTFKAHNFEEERHFEGCMPLEALAARGPKTLNFGPLKPVGFTDPRSGRRPWAVLQLRAETADMRACNLVGCQTKLLQREQKRIFRLVPGLEHAEFVRFGSMHRNTYVNAPVALNRDLSLRTMPDTYLAGQITGVEGYIESAAAGLWLGLSLAARAKGAPLPQPPRETALGALLGHLREPVKDFQPSNINFGLMPPLDGKFPKKDRKRLYAERARGAFDRWLQSAPLNGH